ncbi:MAG: ImmA/IrrE family metallo-endopeptidase [Lachnospira sp.]
MTKYEKLLTNAKDNNVDVYDNYDFRNTRFKGLYCDGVVAISNNLTQKEKACVLAEELGHFYTSTGNILDLTDTANLKQETRARLWSYNRLIGLQGLISSYKANRQTLTEVADYLDVTEEFLKEALDCYRSKYGVAVKFNNYIIGFEPTLYVLELSE